MAELPFVPRNARESFVINRQQAELQEMQAAENLIQAKQQLAEQAYRHHGSRGRFGFVETTRRTFLVGSILVVGAIGIEHMVMDKSDNARTKDAIEAIAEEGAVLVVTRAVGKVFKAKADDAALEGRRICADHGIAEPGWIEAQLGPIEPQNTEVDSSASYSQA